jgi:dipeptidyl aminopeptidase/acylaminoacyl peptidase
LREFTKAGSWRWIGAHPDGRTSFLGFHSKLGFGFYTVSADGTVTAAKRTAAAAPLITGGNGVRQRFQWDPRGRALYVEGLAGQLRNIWKVQVDPVTLAWTSVERLTTGASAEVGVALSRDGSHLAFTTEQTSGRLWSFPFDSIGRRLGEGRAVTEEGADVGGFDLSPDGTSVVFTLIRLGTPGESVWLTNLDTGHSDLLADNGSACGWRIPNCAANTLREFGLP